MRQSQHRSLAYWLSLPSTYAHGPWSEGGSNFSIPIPGAADTKEAGDPAASFEDEISRTIVDCEVNASEWTLMHRYNKAADLLNQALQVHHQAESLAPQSSCISLAALGCTFLPANVPSMRGLRTVVGCSKDRKRIGGRLAPA